MSEHFYTNISKYYPHIFPFNPLQIEFLKHVLPYNGTRVLDVGCATGDLSFALAHFGFPTWAIDFDAQMIEIAQNTKPEETMFPVFEQQDMRSIDQHYPASFFDVVICFGNTLVHLLTDEDIRKFIRATWNVLSTEGKLTIQILNYQHIIDNKINRLPLIDNEQVKFERLMVFHESSALIDFNTKLTIKSTSQEIDNSVKLHAIRKNRLQELLEEGGFEGIEFFGNFKHEPLAENCLPLIVICQKGKK